MVPSGLRARRSRGACHAVATSASGDIYLYQPELQQLRHHGHTADADGDLRIRGGRIAGVHADGDSGSPGNRAANDDQRQLHQSTNGVCLDRRRLHRPHHRDVQGKQEPSKHGHVRSERDQRIRHRRCRADRGYLAVAPSGAARMRRGRVNASR